MKTGLDVLIADDFKSLKGKRVGLVTHAAALASDLRSAMEIFVTATEFELVALFGPEHGLSGEAQDLIPVKADADGPVRVHSLYGETFASLTPTAQMLEGLDVLVIDLQDVGSRYYTFQATMLYCMQACAAAGVEVMVLDRFNPLDRFIEGPTVSAGFESFVGAHWICTVHGMSMGELARLYQTERVPGVKLSVIKYEWNARFHHTWNWTLPPSPNMPTLETARVYPGICLIEGTNLSEGRGTTRPFEYVGYPGTNGREVADAINASLSVRSFLPVTFRPTFQKHAGKTCGGVFVRYGSVRAGLATIIAFRNHLGDKFKWRTETYEFVSHIPAIDLLFGSDRERTMIEAGASWQEIAKEWEADENAFRERRRPYLLY